MRGFGVAAPVPEMRSPRIAYDVTSSSCAAGVRPVMTYRLLAASKRTAAPFRQARLIARKALFSAGFSASAGPAPVMRPGKRRNRARHGMRVEPGTRGTVKRRGVGARVHVVRRRTNARVLCGSEHPHLRARIRGQRRCHRDGAHTHLHRQRPARRIVRRVERTAGRFTNLRILLRIQHFARERRELLIGRDHPGAGRK